MTFFDKSLFAYIWGDSQLKAENNVIFADAYVWIYCRLEDRRFYD